MWFRAALIAIVAGGCYSPSISTCALACAANDVCPDGFECSNGLCAIENTICSGGNDAMGSDNNIPGCGDTTRMVGEICFKPPMQIDTGASAIHDAQFLDGNGDSVEDIAFLNDTSVLFRVNTAGTFATTNTVGLAVPMGLRMKVYNFNASTPEIVVQNKMTGVIQVWSWNGVMWAVGGSQTSDNNDAVAIDVGRLNGVNMPPSIVMVESDRVRMYQLPGGGALMPLNAAGTGMMLTGGRDVATGDFDNNNVGEFAVAVSTGVEIWTGLTNSLQKLTTVTIGQQVDAVTACNVDNIGGAEILYVIRAPGGAGTTGRLGVIRQTGPTTFQETTPRLIDGIFGAVDCTDFDTDGYADAVVAVTQGGNVGVLVFRGRSDATFEDAIVFPVPSPLTQIRANADFNRDNQNDIVLTSANLGLVTILESNP